MEARFIEYRKVSGVYMIRSKSMPELMYIGSTESISDRWRGHISTLTYNRHSKKIQQHFDQYGLDDFEFIVLEQCPKEKLRQIEQFYLTKHKPVWNIRHYAQRPKDNYNWSETARVNFTERKKSFPKRDNWYLTHTMDEDWRLNISKGHLGIRPTKETLIKKSEVMKGRFIGDKSYRSKKVIEYDLDGNYVATHGSIREAARSVGNCLTFVIQCLSGKKKSSKYILKYES